LRLFVAEDEQIAPLDLKLKDPVKSKWDDEDVDDNDVKESWEDEDEPAPVWTIEHDVTATNCLCMIVLVCDLGSKMVISHSYQITFLLVINTPFILLLCYANATSVTIVISQCDLY